MRAVLQPGPPLTGNLPLCSWEEIDLSTPLDYHIHTDYTDGTAGVSHMAEAAVSKGIVRILFSEHIRHTSLYFPSYRKEIGNLKYPGLKAYVGVEAKILDIHGHLDCSPHIASECDAIIGSVHSLPPDQKGRRVDWLQLEVGMAVQMEYELALSVVKKSRAHILGHPMGMVIKHLKLKPAEHLYHLACACRDSGKAFELNPHYCPDRQAWIDIVQKAGCKVSFGSDAHIISSVGQSWRIFVLDGGSSCQ